MRIGLNPFQKSLNVSRLRHSDAAGTATARLTEAERNNVVLLLQRRRVEANDNRGLHLTLGDGRWRAQETSRLRRTLYWSALVGVVLLMHSAVVFAFMGHTEPQASVGLESISVEVVLGAQTAAGLASAPSESEAPASEPASEPPSEPEVAEKEPETPQPAVEAEALKRVKPMEKPRPQKIQPKRTATTTPVVSNAPTSVASTASTASSGIGQGRSSTDSNYLGLVAAHLAKHKRFPPEASATGSVGITTITFVIDGQGHFVTAQLTQSSGIPSLDTETQEMVRRASPFPAPPSGQATSFTVPVNFSLKN